MLQLFSKTSFSNAFLVLFSAILLASCATPRPILRITPKETDKIRYWQGKEIITAQNDSIKIILSYDRQNNYAVGDFSMDCSITNLSSKDILISPEAFYYLTEKMMHKTSYSATTAFATNNREKKEIRAKVSAMNPETAILDAEIRQSVQEAEAKNQRTRDDIAQVASAISLGASVVKSVSDRNSSSEQRRQNSNNLQNAAINMQISNSIAVSNEIRSQNVAQQTQNFINNLHSEPLRKTTLGQGQEVNGKLIFKFYTAYKELTFVFKVADYVFEVPYLQTIIVPKF